MVGRKLVVAVCAGLVLTGCGDSAMLDASGVRSEIEAARGDTSLPAGTDVDVPELEDGDLYEPGFGYMLVQSQAVCLWMREWVEARADGDEAAEQAAWAFIEDVPTLRYFDEAGPNHRERTRDRIERAALGDPAPVAEYVRANCPRREA